MKYLLTYGRKRDLFYWNGYSNRYTDFLANAIPFSGRWNIFSLTNSVTYIYI